MKHWVAVVVKHTIVMLMVESRDGVGWVTTYKLYGV